MGRDFAEVRQMFLALLTFIAQYGGGGGGTDHGMSGGGGYSAGYWIVVALIAIVVIVAAVWAIRAISRRRSGAHAAGSEPHDRAA